MGMTEYVDQDTGQVFYVPEGEAGKLDTPKMKAIERSNVFSLDKDFFTSLGQGIVGGMSNLAGPGMPNDLTRQLAETRATGKPTFPGQHVPEQLARPIGRGAFNFADVYGLGGLSGAVGLQGGSIDEPEGALERTLGGVGFLAGLVGPGGLSKQAALRLFPRQTGKGLLARGAKKEITRQAFKRAAAEGAIFGSLLPGSAKERALKALIGAPLGMASELVSGGLRGGMKAIRQAAQKKADRGAGLVFDKKAGVAGAKLQLNRRQQLKQQTNQ